MAKILFVNCCARPSSRTLELAYRVLEGLEGQVEEVKLYKLSLSALDMDGLKKREQGKATGDFSDPAFDLAKQFALADKIVIAAPYWDLSFPSVLKTYLETVSVSGIVFEYSQQGIPVGLCRADRLYYVTTAGGYIGGNDFGFLYVKALAQSLYGIGTVSRFSAEGLDIVSNDANAIMEKAKRAVDAEFYR